MKIFITLLLIADIIFTAYMAVKAFKEIKPINHDGIDAEDVRSIRLMYLSGDFTQTRLASIYKVHLTTINRILIGQLWPAVTRPGPIPMHVVNEIETLHEARREKERSSQNGHNNAA